MKHVDGFVLMRIPQSGAVRVFWDVQSGVALGVEPTAENWLSDYHGETDLDRMIAEISADDYIRDLLQKNPKANGEDFVIARARVYEDGALATYGRARKGVPAEIGDEERPEAVIPVEDVLRPFGETVPFAAPQFEAGVFISEIEVEISDREEFIEHFELPAGFDGAIVATRLAGRFIDPFEDRDFGATLLETAVEMEGDLMKVRITAEITEPRLFNQRVAHVARDCGHDHDYTPTSAGDAIFQAWCGLNDTPSPADIGLQINTWRDATETPSIDMDL